jgi:hypothetical protein
LGAKACGVKGYCSHFPFSTLEGEPFAVEPKIHPGKITDFDLNLIVGLDGLLFGGFQGHFNGRFVVSFDGDPGFFAGFDKHEKRSWARRRIRSGIRGWHSRPGRRALLRI